VLPDHSWRGLVIFPAADGNNSGAPTLGINRLGFDSDSWPFVQ
jgi:hypothetical protein